MNVDEKDSEGVRKFALRAETITAIWNDLRTEHSDAKQIAFGEASAVVLIPVDEGKVFLGIDERAVRIPSDELPVVRPRSLNPAAIFVGEGSRIMWISIGGDLEAISV